MTDDGPSAETGADDGASGGRLLWLDPTFGAAGDMILGALLGLASSTDTGSETGTDSGTDGADPDDTPDEAPDRALDVVRAGLDGLGLDGWSLSTEPVLRGSLSATRAVVDAPEGHHHRTWSSIDALLVAADLPDRARSGARATFRRLGEVEAAIHRIDIDQVHFHEVGALDAIIDIVGSWVALDHLGVDRVVVGPVGLGSGTTRAAHGQLPVPAPATADLLAGAPIRPLDLPGSPMAETVTPTGAALLATMASRWGPIPAGHLVATARGAGTRDPDGHPNVITAHLLAGETSPSTGAGDTARAEPSLVITTNLDDVTAETIGYIIDRALAAGADDAWATPIVMKKNRPGLSLSVLCQPDRLADLQRLVFTETGTLGLRVQPADKRVLDRRFDEVLVEGQTIRIKVGPHGAKPEHDDLVAAVHATGRPLRQLAAEALAAHRHNPGSGPPHPLHVGDEDRFD